MMQADQRVYLKSDKAGRSLALAFCLAPVLVPAFTIGAVLTLREWPHEILAVSATLTSSAQAAAPMPPAMSLGVLPSRDQFDTSVFADPVQIPAPFETAGQTFVAQTSFASGTHVLRNVEAREGLQLAADHLIVKLEGVAPVPEGSECRRLDGVVEPCSERARNRLEILTRDRPVTCTLRPDESGDVSGACRVGKIDLAEDLFRNGLALRPSN